MFVQWTANSSSAFVQNMGINHGGADIFVAQQFLHRSDIISICKQMGGEAVAKRMAGDGFIDPGHLRSFLDRFIQTALMNMMTSLYAASWINGNRFGWKHILPGELRVGVFVFFCTAHRAGRHGQTLLTNRFHAIVLRIRDAFEEGPLCHRVIW